MSSNRLLSTLRGLAVWMPLSALSWCLAWAVRYDFVLSREAQQAMLATLPVAIGIKLVAAALLQGFHEWMRYVSFRDLVLLAITTLAASCGIIVFDQLLQPWLGSSRDPIPAAVLVLDWMCTLLLIGGAHSLWRFQSEHMRPLMSRLLWPRNFQAALLVGANRTGLVLATQIECHPKLTYAIAGFLDNDEKLHGTRLGGILVRGRLTDVATIAADCGARDVFVLDGSLSPQDLRNLLNDCHAAGVQVRIVGNVYCLVKNAPAGRSPLQMRDVHIDDLLRREPVKLDTRVVGQFLTGRVVMITGAGGSIGSEICRQVAHFKPKTLVLVERAENSLFHIERELKAAFCNVTIVPMVADITDERRMRQVFELTRPEVLFHAAAHKHVPMMETNPSEAIANNSLGTKLVADLAHEYQLQSFVLISTDKAVNPTSVMGLSKQLAERFVHELAQSSSTRFVVVRFGNVLGSNGSVVPLFQEQIRAGGPVKVTHPEMRRYFMTIPEASQLVLQAGAMGKGGEIFVLDMGEPVKIVDLATDMIRLSGYSLDQIGIVFTGIRPGEKLYEELYFDEERTLPTPHPKVRVAHHRMHTATEMAELLAELQMLVCESDVSAVHRRLREMFAEFCAPEHAAPTALANDSYSASAEVVEP